ncbi:MAG: NADH-quinone oxidoreductase subunit C, partial [Bacteroidota bacterium]
QRLSMTIEEIKQLLEDNLPGSVEGERSDATPAGLIISEPLLVDVCRLLHSNPSTYFDSLSCLSGLDGGSESGVMEVIYHLYSIPFNLHLALYVVLDRVNPEVDSVSDVWRGANWHERETYDLLGIKFKNHPDLRRILLPEDWEGYPLRKDYVEQELYHDIKVKY